jgi:hypothetical protein
MYHLLWYSETLYFGRTVCLRVSWGMTWSVLSLRKRVCLFAGLLAIRLFWGPATGHLDPGVLDLPPVRCNAPNLNSSELLSITLKATKLFSQVIEFLFYFCVLHPVALYYHTFDGTYGRIIDVVFHLKMAHRGRNMLWGKYKVIWVFQLRLQAYFKDCGYTIPLKFTK